MANLEYKRIIILGSGFSKAISSKMPTIPDLSKKLFTDLLNSHDPQFHELVNYLARFTEISDENSFRSIENVATSIFSKKLFVDFHEREYFRQLKWQLLFYIYNQLKDFDVDIASKDILINFFTYSLHEHSKDGTNWGKNLFVTFNYDLLIEKFIEKKRHEIGTYKVDYGIELNRYHSFLCESTPAQGKTFQLLKLHGSFNWFQAKGSDNYDLNSIYQVDPDDINYFIHRNDLPLFVPMAHAKELFLFGTLYSTLWTKFDYYLKNATEIYFIGYGFPPTDINNLLYFYQFNKTIKKIIVYYPNDDQIDFQRLRKIFGKKVINENATKFLASNYKQFCCWNLDK